MLPQEIKLVDDILKSMLDVPFRHPMDIRDEFASRKGYRSNDVHFAMAELKRCNLIEPMPGRNFSIMLSQEGMIAGKIGIEDYLRYKERQIEKENKSSYKKNLMISILSSIIGAIIGVILTMLLSQK